METALPIFCFALLMLVFVLFAALAWQESGASALRSEIEDLKDELDEDEEGPKDRRTIDWADFELVATWQYNIELTNGDVIVERSELHRRRDAKG